MLKVYDKAQWHIDAGENKEMIVAKMTAVLMFLDDKEFLTDEGKEILDIGIDSSVSIHERMLTDEGNRFIESNYDKVINNAPDDIKEALEKAYDKANH